MQQHLLLQHRRDYPALVFSTLRALSAMKTLMQALDSDETNGQASSIPFPFFSFLTIINMQDPYFTSHNIFYTYLATDI